LTDVKQQKWCIGKTIGSGAFGDVYLVSRGTKAGTAATARYVAKLEPHANGPLFTEVHFLTRVGLPAHRYGFGLLDDL
jgi:vaccinia related kinase